MKVIIGSDHGGFELKEKIKTFLKNKNFEIIDVGTHSTDSVDYPDYAKKVVQLIQTGDAEKGILVCGTGIGISIAANKFKGIRAALIYNGEAAKLSIEHNDSNIFVVGGRTMNHDEVLNWLMIWFNSEFQAGRHERRIEKINNL
ncbi:ribose 5-phosphate isomerase B [Candidatus Dependentiae bacterium]|nr:ribose 5-phosphate isomerase B [Candidatus Dependentiae bacterium]